MSPLWLINEPSYGNKTHSALIWLILGSMWALTWSRDWFYLVIHGCDEPSMTHSWALYDSFMRPHMETRLILPWYICAPWLIVPRCAIWRHDLMTSWLNAASYGDEIHSALIYMCTMTHSATLCHDSLCHKETWWLNDLITEWLNDWMT